MLTLEQLSDRLESLYTAIAVMYKNQNALADELYSCKLETKEADTILKSIRAAAVAANEIQQKEHGANATLRNAHERDYLKVQYLDLENAELREKQARHDFDQVQRELSGMQKRISLTQSQVQIHKLVILNSGIPLHVALGESEEEHGLVRG